MLSKMECLQLNFNLTVYSINVEWHIWFASLSLSLSLAQSYLFLLSEHKLVITSFMDSTVLCATWHNCSAADISHNSFTTIINQFFYLTNSNDLHDNIALHRHCFQALDCIQNGNRSFLADRSRSSVFRWEKRQSRVLSSTQFPTYFILYSLFFCNLFIVLETVPLNFSLTRSVCCILCCLRHVINKCTYLCIEAIIFLVLFSFLQFHVFIEPFSDRSLGFMEYFFNYLIELP